MPTPNSITSNMRRVFRESDIPPGAIAMFEQFYASIAETCKDNGVVLDDNAIGAMVIAVSAIDVIQQAAIDRSPLTRIVADSLHHLMTIGGLDPSLFVRLALASSLDPDLNPNQ
jgi:hypothetical protein